MKLTEEIEEFISLTITEHMGKEYADWKMKQQSVTCLLYTSDAADE